MIETWQGAREQADGPEQPAAAQYLCFWLGTQSYALPVGEVREIRAMGSWCSLPGSPAWVLGAMNLRGLVIPLIDLRIRFSIAPAAPGVAPVLIVATAGGKLAGLVVDGVMDVADIAHEALRHGPEDEAASVEARCVTGVASLGDSVVIAWNIEGGTPPHW